MENSLKMRDIFWKPWLNWAPQQQKPQDREKVNIE
jgi:hypothetical protein